MSDADALGEKRIQDAVRLFLGQILSKGDLAEARARYEQALNLEQSAHARTEETETRYFMAQLAIEERRPVVVGKGVYLPAARLRGCTACHPR